MKKILFFILVLNQWFAVAQFDTSFNATGLVLPPYALPVSGTFYSSSDYKVGLLPEGKIVTFGYTNEGAARLVLRRYLANGSPDTTFGNAGVAAVSNGAGQFGATTTTSKCEFLSNGKYLFASYTQLYNIGTASVHLTQLNADGTIDTTYGINGSKDIANVPYFIWSTDDIKFLPDGRIYIIGENRYNVGTAYYFLPVVIGLTAAHTLDSTFGTNGFFMPDSLGTSNFLTSPNILSLYGDGSLLINTAGNTGKNLIKMTPGGQVDLSFGTNGIKTTETIIHTICVLPDNKFLASGPVTLYNSPTSNITRYNTDFTIDTTFGTNGSVVGSFGKTVVQPDGKILTLQTNGSPGFITSYTAYVKRYNADGSLDANYQILFGTKPSKQIFDISLQPDGKILACGSYQYAESTMPYYTAPWLARLLPGLQSELDVKDYALAKTSVFPNPFHDQLTLSYELEAAQNISIDLIDLQGRTIQRICQDEMQSGSVTRDIPLGGLSSGTYLLRITSATGLQKIVKIAKE